MSILTRLSPWLPPFLRGDEALHGEDKVEIKRLRGVERVLSREVEEVFEQYDAELRDIATRLQQVENVRDAKALREELRALHERQESVWRILFRFQARGKTTQILQRELAQWEDRSDGEVRAEMIRSELAIRHGASGVMSSSSEEDSTVLSLTDIQEMTEDEWTLSLPPPPVPPSPPALDMQHVLVAIREATREAERWHAFPHSAQDREAIEQVRHVKELHAALKRLDRNRGIRRERLSLALRVRDIV